MPQAERGYSRRRSFICFADRDGLRRLAESPGRTIVCQAIESLPIALRVIVILADIEGFSRQDTAAIVGCPVELVATRLHRAHQRLRDQLRNLVRPTASNP